ncbi:1-acyl-sn-glycerol-3-phosphate acyltransferase, partial [Mycoplasma hyopneumoniae]|nr:1-acyl-sn-glycerol-3-phosphate acyltransferase [Mesomycoplasma hyopneumoniae]
YSKFILKLFRLKIKVFGYQIILENPFFRDFFIF